MLTVSVKSNAKHVTTITAGKPQAHAQYLRRVLLLFLAGWERASLPKIIVTSIGFSFREKVSATTFDRRPVRKKYICKPFTLSSELTLINCFMIC